MDGAVLYPAEYERWWMEYARRQFQCDSLSQVEHELEMRIQSLSDLFTKERESLPLEYLKNPKALAAYGLFFFPQNFVRVQLILRELFQRGWMPPKSVRILDLGAGTGAASHAVAAMLAAGPAITAVDRSAPALSVFLEMCASSIVRLQSCIAEEADLRQWLLRQNSQWDLIVASFSLNEMDLSIEHFSEHLGRIVAENGIVIVIEPAFRVTSEKLEMWRDFLTASSEWRIWAPCLHQQLCPLLQEGNFWCHEVRRWQPPESLSFLNRHLYRQIHVLKFSFLAFGRNRPESVSPSAFRLISPVSRRKKTLVFTGCCADGLKHEFHVSSGTITEERRKQLRDLERGDIAALDL